MKVALLWSIVLFVPRVPEDQTSAVAKLERQGANFNQLKTKMSQHSFLLHYIQHIVRCAEILAGAILSVAVMNCAVLDCITRQTALCSLLGAGEEK